MTGVRLSADLLVKIERWAARQADRPSKAEAIRRLLIRTLKSEPG